MWIFHQTQPHREPCNFPHPLSTPVHISGYDFLSEPPIFVFTLGQGFHNFLTSTQIKILYGQ